MSAYIIQEKTLTDIADAVREKSGTSDLILVGDLPAAISNIQTGGGDSQWEEYWRKTATHFTLPEGITSIQQYAFMNHENLEPKHTSKPQLRKTLFTIAHPRVTTPSPVAVVKSLSRV